MKRMNQLEEIPSEFIHLNPWCFEDRIRLFALLIEQTHISLPSVPSMIAFAQDPLGLILNTSIHNDNLLFGFLIQFLWQAKSGRLCLHSRGDSKGFRISNKSWWAGVNYYLCVIPLFGAQKAAWNPILNAIKILPDPLLSAPKFLSHKDGPFLDDRLAPLIDAWYLYFLKIRDYQALKQNSLSELSGLMWNAHNASICYATSILTEELKLSSLDEQLFGMGWASMVGTFAETNPVITTRKKTEKANDLMFPPRILLSEDTLSDFSVPQQEFVKFMQALSSSSLKLNARL